MTELEKLKAAYDAADAFEAAYDAYKAASDAYRIEYSKTITMKQRADQ